MRKTLLIKIAALAPIVVVTWLITSTIIAKAKAYSDGKPVPKKSGSQEPTGSMTVAPDLKDSAHAGQAITKSVPHKAVLIMKPLQVEIQGQQVFVKGSADMMSIYRNKTYMWKLQVYSNGEENPSIAIPYAEQAFAMDPSGTMKPTFSETFFLPPGKHRISLTLHTLQAGLGLDELRVAEQKPSALGAEKTIEIR